MCACRLEEMYPNSSKRTSVTYDLDDFIFEMENQPHFESTSTDHGDVYSQLAQKEKDLILAAELGKALLEKNELLHSTNERLCDDYTKKLEQLEQEKYALKRKLDSIEAEYESKMMELQSDIKSLQLEVEEKNQAVKYSEKERVSLVGELSEQNQRLTDQLKSASFAEDQLATQLKNLRDQFHARRSNMSDHLSQLELLREEITIITEKKAELERRLMNLAEERDSISLSLDETTDRILLLEKLNAEQEMKLRQQERDIEELQHINVLLQERVDFFTKRCSTPASLANTSLLNEIEMSEDDGHGTGSNLPSRSVSSPMSMNDLEEEDEDDDIECDDSALIPLLKQQSEQKDELRQFKEEVLDAYIQLQNLCLQVKHRRGSASVSSTSSDDTQLADIRVGLLTDSLKQLKGLLHDILRREAKGVCGSCERGPEDREHLERELNVTQEELLRTQRKLVEKTEANKQHKEEIITLNGKIDVLKIELQNSKDECALLRQDLQNTHLSKEEVVSKAWEDRDKAIKRKNNLEIDLAKTRIEVMHINSQLIEAITQKLELSQQLEMWQVDMQALLDNQMTKKLTQHEQGDKAEESDGNTSGSGAANTKPGLFRFWR